MTTRPRHTPSILVAVLLLSGATSLFGSPVGSISGLVRDQTSTVAAGVKLTLTNLSTSARTMTAGVVGGGPRIIQFSMRLSF